MKNSITAFVEFYFKGEKFTPSMVIDLDAVMARQGGFTPEALHRTIAQHNGIGSYSYELEVMESEEIQYKDPHGFAQDFFDDGQFDIPRFTTYWQREDIRDKLTTIANQHLGIDSPKIDDKLFDALAAAYQLGQQSAQQAR